MTLLVTKEKGPFWIPKEFEVFGEASYRLGLLTSEKITFNGQYGATRGGLVFAPTRIGIPSGSTKPVEYKGCKFIVTGT